jgi:hypothetical protein
MSGETSDLGSRNAKTGLGSESLTGHGLTDQEKVPGKIGTALKLNGESQYLNSAGHASNTFTIAAWIKWNGGTGSQTIVTTDSTGTGRSGWRVGINAQGKIEMSTHKNTSTSWSATSAQAVVPDVWTYLACQYFINGTNGSGLAFYLNGSPAGGIAGANLRFVPGGHLSVGRNKDGSGYFNGTIDELRIYNAAKPNYWLANEYRNQKDPASFYSIGAEEANTSSWVTFTGAASTNWATAVNWLNNTKPISGSKVRILAGKTTRITGEDLVFGQLVLEPGAVLSSGVNLQLNCNATLGAGAALNLDAGKKLVLAGNGLRLSGEGVANADILEISAANSTSEIELQSEVTIAEGLNLIKGRFNTNGKLWLLASRQTAAALLPVLNPDNVSIAGEVNVQSFVDGSFPEPSSGRGWRLWSAPVKNIGNRYSLLGIKSNVFVTGKGGSLNGFDASPNNGATIYTHEQLLPGALKEKYVPIPDLNHTIPIGRGFYIFSRGSRLAENAYHDQIQTQPFQNPVPYLVTYKGELYVGELTIEVFNRNLGGEGDGYNLLGNPYASPIKWGSLIKENVGPFVWMYDPLNGTYLVTDNPETVIPAGAGFFVKVMNGFTTGKVTFTEGCKVRPSASF